MLIEVCDIGTTIVERNIKNAYFTWSNLFELVFLYDRRKKPMAVIKKDSVNVFVL